MNYIDTQDFKKYSILAEDGKFGSVFDFYFDEDTFLLRYLVVDSEPFLLRNLVLISPIIFRKINLAEKTIELSITKKEIADSPGLDSGEVVSSQYEKTYNDHFSWPYYWGSYGNSTWAAGPYGINEEYGTQVRKSTDDIEEKNNLIRDAKSNSLRSLREVRSYSIRGSENEEFGHIQGFILNPDTLSFDFVVIDTVNYLPSKNILLRPEWIENILWQSKVVKIKLSKKLIKSAPSYKNSELDEKLIEITDKHFKGILHEDTRHESSKDMKLSFLNFRQRKERLKKIPD